MDIGTAMAKFQGYEGALTVTPNPVTGASSLTTKRAYLYIPEKTDAIPEIDPIGFFNGWELLYENRMVNAQREHKYIVTVQGLVRDPSLDSASKIASAFHAALMAALDLHQQLEGACTLQQLKAGRLTRLEWGGYPFIGFEHKYEVSMRDTTTAGA